MKYRAVFSKHNSVINHLGQMDTLDVVVNDDDDDDDSDDDGEFLLYMMGLLFSFRLLITLLHFHPSIY